MQRTALTAAALVIGLIGASGNPASAQLMTKPQVANLIKNVENGVDEFRNYLEKRGDNAKDNASTAKASGRRKGTATESQKAAASNKKDDLDDALGDLKTIPGDAFEVVDTGDEAVTDSPDCSL